MSEADRFVPALAGRYEIARELGRGGTATVYLARDLRHDRPVAIKVLHGELAAMLGSERFLAEIRVTANLQHPNILPLFDSGEVDGQLYYVMPYVEGESLRAKLDREQQLSVEEAIGIATDVAGALEYAHRRGLVHRDIKPENILLSGRAAGPGASRGPHRHNALVADFGIALAVSHAGVQRLTQTGVTLGTPQYMSPEQAGGERLVTDRSDIYALGAVLYEMLAGEPPFSGPTAQATFARILTDEPRSLLTLRRATPPWVATAVHRALEKVPADRFASAEEFAAALVTPADAAGNASSLLEVHQPRARDLPPQAAGGPPRATADRRWRTVLPWGITALLAIAASALAWRLPRITGPATAINAERVVRFTVPLPAGTRIPFNNRQAGFALSPDGASLVILGRSGDTSRLYVRRLDSLDTKALPGTDDAQWPVMSPDGAWIAFVQRGRLVKARSDGTTPIDLGEANWALGDWGRDGFIYYSPYYKSSLSRVAAGGGTSETLTRLDSTRRELTHGWARVLPGGRAVLFTNFTVPLGLARIEAIIPATGERRVLIEGGLDARYLRSGHLVFARGEVLMGVRFDADSLRVIGSPVPLVEGVAVMASVGASAYAVAENGTLAYVPAAVAMPPAQLVWVDRAGAERLAVERAADYEWPRLSPDGRRIAVSIRERGIRNLWVLDTARQLLTRITAFDAPVHGAEWTRDGRELIYPLETPVFDLFSSRADGSASEDTVLMSRFDKILSSIAPDGSAAVFTEGSPTTGEDIVVVGLGGTRVRHEYLRTRFNESHASISPDGNWMAYHSNQSGRLEVYVSSYPDPSRARVQVSATGGEQPRWTRGGRELVYRTGRHFKAVAFDAETGRIGAPVELFPDRYEGVGANQVTYDVSADGARFLLVKAPAELPQEVVVVLNWMSEVEAKVRE